MEYLGAPQCSGVNQVDQDLQAGVNQVAQDLQSRSAPIIQVP